MAYSMLSPYTFHVDVKHAVKDRDSKVMSLSNLSMPAVGCRLPSAVTVTLHFLVKSETASHDLVAPLMCTSRHTVIGLSISL